MAREVDEYFSRMIDLIPPPMWGFDADANKKILLYKCKKVDSNLTNKEKKNINPKDKSCYARCSKVIADKISEIFEIIRIKEEGKLIPKKSGNIEVPVKGEINSNKETVKKQKQRKKLTAKEKAKLKKEKKEKALRNEKRKGDTTEDEPLSKKAREEETEDVEMEDESKNTNSKLKLSFSKIKGITDKGEKKITNAEKKDTFKGRDYKALLKKAEKREEKIAKIREENPEKADKIEEDIKWKAALKRAEGEKIKDNPKLLKAASKRKESIKETRAKKWELRKKTVEENKKKKQAKREENITKRRQEKVDKKIAKNKKKGRVILSKKT